MHRIVTEIDRPSDEAVAAFDGVPAPVASDVMDKNRRTMDHGMKPVADTLSVAGPAVTVDATPGDNLVLHRAMALAEPGDVLVVDADGYPEAGIWGELMSVSAQNYGLAGTVVDGAVRDSLDVAEVGYPLFSRAISPKGSNKQLPGSINVPVSCGGVGVSPGDVVVGDADGVAVVPRAELDEVAAACHEKLEAEAATREEADTASKFEEQFDRILGDLEE